MIDEFNPNGRVRLTRSRWHPRPDGTPVRSASPRRIELNLRPFKLVTIRFRAPITPA